MTKLIGATLAITMLAGCHPAYCEFAGMQVVDEPTEEVWSCSRLSAVAELVMNDRKWPSRPDGYTIHLVNEYSWSADWIKDEINGYSDCFTREVYIGKFKYVFAHELVHVLQGCHARLPRQDDNDEYHSNWTIDGINDLIGETNAL